MNAPAALTMDNEVQTFTADAWGQLSVRVGRFVDEIAARRDLMTVVGIAATPELAGGRPAGAYSHTTATVTIDAAQTLSPSDDPNQIDLRDRRDRARFPVLTGVAVHEAGHAAHTVRRGRLSKAAGAWAALLEEPRMEGRVVARRPQDRVWLRSSASHLLGSCTASSASSAARLLILVGGRIDAGVYDRCDLPDLAEVAGEFLTEKQIGIVVEQTRVAVALDDGDVDGLVRCAESIAAAIVDEFDDADVDSEGSDGDDGAGCSPQHGVSEGAGDEIAASGKNTSLRDALAAMARRTAATAQAAEHITPPSAAAARVTTAAENQRQMIAAAGRVASTGRLAHSVRRPTDGELAQSLRLNRAVEAALDRGERTQHIPQAVPPGRMRIRELARREGQIAAGMIPTATPWSRTRRTVVEAPPWAVGIAVDVSQSMEPVLEISAVTAWMVNRAAVDRGAAATVVWNAKAANLPAESIGGAVYVPEAGGVSDGLPEALLALDSRLQLTSGAGTRLVVVITDADLPNLDEIYHQAEQLVSSQTRMLWLIAGQINDGPPAHLIDRVAGLPGVTITELDDPARVADIVGEALVALLESESFA